MGRDILEMPFAGVYPLLVRKAERKGRTRDEVDTLTSWLLGYTKDEIASALEGETSYGDFFRYAPAPNPLAERVGGRICDVKIEEIESPIMRSIRRLDKLVDELAKGKPVEKLLPA